MALIFNSRTRILYLGTRSLRQELLIITGAAVGPVDMNTVNQSPRHQNFLSVEAGPADRPPNHLTERKYKNAKKQRRHLVIPRRSTLGRALLVIQKNKKSVMRRNLQRKQQLAHLKCETQLIKEQRDCLLSSLQTAVGEEEHLMKTKEAAQSMHLQFLEVSSQNHQDLLKTISQLNNSWETQWTKREEEMGERMAAVENKLFSLNAQLLSVQYENKKLLQELKDKCEMSVSMQFFEETISKLNEVWENQWNKREEHFRKELEGKNTEVLSLNTQLAIGTIQNENVLQGLEQRCDQIYTMLMFSEQNICTLNERLGSHWAKREEEVKKELMEKEKKLISVKDSLNRIISALHLDKKDRRTSQ